MSTKPLTDYFKQRDIEHAEKGLGQYTVVLLLVALGFSGVALAGSVVYPWRAAPTIVRTGDKFQIMFKAKEGEVIAGITLQGPYQKIDIPAGNVTSKRGDFSYDPSLDVKYSLKVEAIVPAGSPADVYDLAIRTNRREVVSKHSVNVISQYRKRYTIVHITDTHMARNWIGNLETGYPPGLEHLAKIMEVANIIAPDIVVVTGDNIVNFNRNPELAEPGTARKWECFYEGSGGYAGIFGFQAPAFAVPGNHDCGVGVTDRTKSVRQYIELNGLRSFGFSYGTTRFIACDDVLGGYRDKQDIPMQFSALDAYLNKAGAGQMRILLTHHPLKKESLSVPAEFRHAFLDKHKIQLVLNGSAHRNRETFWGTTPTLELTTKNSGIIDRDPGWFRVLVIEGDKILMNQSLRYGDNVKKTALLNLDYQAPNDGSDTRNKATITNQFDMAFPSCHVRFLMKPGKYRVTGGIIEQSFNAGDVTVYDVRLPVSAHGKATVTIWK